MPEPAARAATTYVQLFLKILTRPAAFFETVREETSLRAPLTFAALMGLVAGAVYAILGLVGLRGAGGVGAALFSLVLTPVFAVLFGSFVGGAITHVIALIAGGKGTFQESVRISSYALAVIPVGAVLGFVPFVEYVPSFYGLYIVALGVIALHRSDRKRTFVVAGVLAGLLALFAISATLTGYAARRAARDLEARYGAGSQFQKDLERSAQEMEKMAEELRKATERSQQPAR